MFRQILDYQMDEELRQHVHKHIYEEEELLIDPQFFTDIRGYLPQITDVRIQLRRGHAHNELTRFRYDVILSKGVAEDEQMPSAPSSGSAASSHKQSDCPNFVVAVR